MRKTLIYKKRVQDETGQRIYPVVFSGDSCRRARADLWRGNRKNKRIRTAGRALIAGISEEKKETQYFLERLWCGAAMPAELNALYDDYIGEKEWQDDRGIYAAC